MEYSEMLINRIKDLCRQRGGITIHRLAKMSSLRQSTLDNIIRGNTKDPRVSTLHHIALGFNMTLTEFLDFPELNDYVFDDEEEESAHTVIGNFFFFFCTAMKFSHKADFCPFQHFCIRE